MTYPAVFILLGLISFLVGWFASQRTHHFVTRRLIWERGITMAAMAHAVANGWAYAWDQAEIEAYQAKHDPRLHIYKQSGVIYVSFTNQAIEQSGKARAM